jgi:release factor glutamine methyltransferase
MRIKGNTLQLIKDYFEEELSSHYSASERLILFRLAVQHINGFSHMEIHLNPGRRVSESELLQYSQFVKQLKQGKPVQYIMGYTWFLDLKIAVNPSVLIPRPETEELVHGFIPFLNTHPTARILDACTGSGCIALAIKHMFPDAQVLGVDSSAEAIQTARENAALLDLDVAFLQQDVFADFVYEAKFDVIVSNPPYIPDAELSEMSVQVRDFEPHQALFVPDADPFVFYRRLIQLALDSLNNGGILAVECHYKGCDATAKLFRDAHFEAVEIQCDLSGNQRFVTGRLESTS